MRRHGPAPTPAADPVAGVAAAVAAGRPPDLAGAPERVVRAVAFATSVGAPLAPVLAATRDAADAALEVERAVALATAQARAAAGALLALPAVLVPALAALLDLDLVGFAATAAGRGVVVLAGGLLVLGAACALLLLRHAHRGLPTAGADEAVDLVAAGLAAGLAAPAALRAVGRTIPQVAGEADRVALALEFGRPPATLGPLGPLAGSLATAAMHGAPAVEAVMRLAAETRAAARAQALERAARLPVLLVFPTALFVLPAVVLLVGGPVVAEALAGLGPVGPGG